MKIAIDYRLAILNPKSGMGVYVSSLTNYLKRLDKVNEYKVLTYTQDFSKKSSLGKVVELCKELYFVNVKLPLLLRRDYDLLYSPNPPAPIFSPVPLVLTIPDLSFWYEKKMNFLIKLYLFLIYFISAHRAKVITTFSENSKEDINKFLKIPKDRIPLVQPAIKKRFFKEITAKQLKSITKKYKIGKKYIISVPGSFIQRKNPEVLLEVFRKLPEKLKNSYLLVFVGNSKGANFEKFKALVKRLRLSDKVIFTGYIPEEDLIALYRGATISVFTSLYEGFGLPPLESMALGTPVIAYRNSSLPEIVGSAGILVNNKNELKSTTTSLLKSKNLRKKFSRLGRQRAKKFSWEKSAAKMLKIFNQFK